MSEENEDKRQFSAPERILVALDGSPLSFRALNYALMLARLTGAEIIAVNVFVIPSFVTSTSVIEELRKQNSSSSTQIFENALRAAEQSKFQSTIKTKIVETGSSVVKAIIDASKEMNADLIIIGTKGTTQGMPRLMLGSVAAGVVSFASCPVLAVR